MAEAALTTPWLFVGLGNPGNQYAGTRHNIGFLVVQTLASSLNWILKEETYWPAQTAKGTIDGQQLHLLLPTTYMNLSGTAVARYLSYYKIPPDRLAVITDDVAIPFGTMRLKERGSAGGHNGLKSIEQCLATNEYTRLRMGVGDNREDMDLADYVLSTFATDEREQLDRFVTEATVVLKRLLKEPLAQVMNRVNTKVKSENRDPVAQENNDEPTQQKTPLRGDVHHLGYAE